MKKYKLGYEVYIDNKDKTYNTDDEKIYLYIGYDKNESADIECLYNDAIKEVSRIYKGTAAGGRAGVDISKTYTNA